MLNKTKALIDIIVYDEKPSNIDNNLLEHAARNKILLHVLRKLNIHNRLRIEQEERLDTIRKTLANIWRNLPYDNRISLIKFSKPVIYVPSDIDLLVHEDILQDTIRVLRNLGFRLQIVEPYCITLIGRKNVIIDLYIYPSVSNIIYLDRDILLNNTTVAEIDGTIIRTLNKEAETLITIAHAVYKENMITLNDYLTVMAWYNSKVAELAKKSNILYAVNITLEYMNLINKGLMETPVRIAPERLLRAYIEKIMNDRLTRSSIIKVIKKMNDKRLGPLILSKLTRKTY